MAKEIVKRQSAITVATQTIRQARRDRIDREEKGDRIDLAAHNLFKTGVESLKIDRDGNIVETIDFDESENEDEE